jgi:hypothetical protein
MSSEPGVQNWYYTRDLPARAVGVAKVTAASPTPANLSSINNTVVQAGSLSIWKQTTPLTSAADWTAPALNFTLTINGTSLYYVGNQFFQITDTLSVAGNPMYYQHPLPPGVSQIAITDVNGNSVLGFDSFTSSQYFYHSLDGAPYYIRYVTLTGNLQTSLLLYNTVYQQVSLAATNNGYVYSGRVLALPTPGTFSLRFVQNNGFMLMPPYDYLPNTPWYPRIRFGIAPPPVDWASQNFTVGRGYQLASYVAGTVLSSSLVEFERKQIYYDPLQLPDILVFNADNSLKYALDGSASNTPKRKGTLYNWKRGAIQSMDPSTARVSLSVSLAPTDIVFGFYNYYEPDVIYTELDINPFTNSVIKNSMVEFYAKFDSSNPANNIFHQVLDDTGLAMPGATNDPNPTVGTNQIFAQLAVGAAISTSEFTMVDVRVRGGGLIPSQQSIPQSVNMWDIGYWDGKPYPIAGALVAYLPLSLLNTFSRSDIEGKMTSILPMGALAVVRYVDDQGQEYV